MGLVVLAQDTVLDVPVALKLVPEMVVHDSEGIVDLKKEVLRGMELTHPNIVRVFSFEQSASQAVIVMEHVQGETLAQKKAQHVNRCFDCDEIRPWIEQLCAALEYAHSEARIAHRDLKPGNLLITTAGRLKVADFGIASSLSETISRVSVRKDSAGTPPYMSPQQAMGERPSHLDDIYSLGATIYELLTSKPPFFRGNILAQVMHEEPVLMRERRVEFGITNCAAIPEAWERTVAACLSKTPDARPHSAAAVLAMLTSDTPGSAKPAESIPGRAAAREIVPAIPPQPKEAPREPKPLPVRARRRIDFQPLINACSALVHGVGEFVGAVIRPIIKFAIVIAVIWGALFLKQKWDDGKAREAELAKKAAMARAADTPDAPAAVAPPQSGSLLQPAPTLIERGPGAGLRPRVRPTPRPNP
jgi:serine/threonine protein kinase